jgi:Na+/H+-translocating membrane pyrophosphatase
MAGDKHRLRNQVMDEVRAGLAVSLRSDLRGVLILLLQIINAVWFATLWELGFPSIATTAMRAVFCAASVGLAVVLERRRAPPGKRHRAR